jgi:hypothetical protein
MTRQFPGLRRKSIEADQDKHNLTIAVKKVEVIACYDVAARCSLPNAEERAGVMWRKCSVVRAGIINAQKNCLVDSS